VSLPWLYAGSVSPPLASQTSSARSSGCAVRQGRPRRPGGDSDRARARAGCPYPTEARLEQADPSPPERRRRTGRLAGSRCPRQPRLRQAEGNDRQRAASRESNVSRFLDQLSLEELEALARHGLLEALSEEEIAEQLRRFSPEDWRAWLRRLNAEAAANQDDEEASMAKPQGVRASIHLPGTGAYRAADFPPADG
jgi:hypothetical protein